jgi:hypothetical protein
MGFYEDWGAQQARKLEKRKALFEQAQSSWVGRRVWYQVLGGHQTYGEVAGIDEHGVAHIIVGYDQYGQPRYWQADIECFGNSVTFADA